MWFRYKNLTTTESRRELWETLTLQICCIQSSHTSNKARLLKSRHANSYTQKPKLEFQKGEVLLYSNYVLSLCTVITSCHLTTTFIINTTFWNHSGNFIYCIFISCMYFFCSNFSLSKLMFHKFHTLNGILSLSQKETVFAFYFIWNKFLQFWSIIIYWPFLDFLIFFSFVWIKKFFLFYDCDS